MIVLSIEKLINTYVIPYAFDWGFPWSGLGRIHPDHQQPSILVFRVDLIQVWSGRAAVRAEGRRIEGFNPMP